MPSVLETNSITGLHVRRDGDLLRLYTEQGAEEAFAELSRRYVRLIYATCLRETGDRSLAEDATQGVLLLLSRKAGALLRHETLAGWLYAASRNVARNLLKQERRRQSTEARAMIETAPPQDQNPLWDRIEPHFHAALDRLKPADREAVLLRYVEEQSLAEVGAWLGITENTARMRVNRALEKIRRHLERAGVAVTVGALALAMERHAAHAVPAQVLASLARIAAGPTATPSSSTPLDLAVQRTARQLLWRSLRPLPAISGALLLLMGIAVYRHAMPHRLDQTERRQFYLSLIGSWQGSLEFVDDASGQRFTYGTDVVCGIENNGDTLRFTAAYPGSSSMDVTTLQPDPYNGGRLAVYNGGPRSTHKLEASGDLFGLRDGSNVYEGFSVAQNRYVRLRFVHTRNQLTIQEEYRRLSRSDYQFRNRFTLQRR
jgi:RNA polymerase sigma factor (sigma-70 family)